MTFSTIFNALQCRLEIAAMYKLQFCPKVTTRFRMKQNKGQQCSFWHLSQKPGIRCSPKDRYGLNRILTKKLLRSRKNHFCSPFWFLWCGIHLSLASISSYIKEFVHGDFGRTKPNIGSLLNRTADILELDVEVSWLLFVFPGNY